MEKRFGSRSRWCVCGGWYVVSKIRRSYASQTGGTEDAHSVEVFSFAPAAISEKGETVKSYSKYGKVSARL